MGSQDTTVLSIFSFISMILSFLIGFYSFYRLIRVLRNDPKKSLALLCYVMIAIGSFGRALSIMFGIQLYHGYTKGVYAALVYSFSFMNTYAYVLLIPLQAKLYYLCKDAEDLVLENNHSKKLVRIYIVTTVFSFVYLVVVALTAIFPKDMLKFFNAFFLIFFVIILLAMLYYGTKLVKTINRIGGKELTKQIKRIILVEIQWCILWTFLSLFRIIKPGLFDQYGLLCKDNIWVNILLLLCLDFPPLALLFVIFKTPNVTKKGNMLLNSYDSSSDEEKSN
ncbi:tobamovirus multiplication protein 1-like isoform x1 [Anaeramoeba flamelloides]|uniref:Tobamovirus multiplication protein 1-like isoform x1 n=1 Tax=Anaeramoeba flamelloides TaxID=1746091 RepID=A0AAV7Y9N0_9EUKA|nr:tobamovirus multiplication protein 1-like isoform x1 [Anaeramoeba flamelloides]